jgi:hypothetical protein
MVAAKSAGAIRMSNACMTGQSLESAISQKRETTGVMLVS